MFVDRLKITNTDPFYMCRLKLSMMNSLHQLNWSVVGTD